MEDRIPGLPDFAEEAKAIKDDLIALRRTIHEDPEIGLVNPRTQQKILAQLEGLPLQITLGEGLSSVVAVLEGDKPGPTVLLRGDMDGLPLHEETGLPYAATGETMHACGHDLHTSGLVGAAKLLSAHKADLPGKVIFMFQPGEEGQGGAQIMIEEGVLGATGEMPIAAYAIHVAPGPRGVFVTKHGCATAGSNQMYATIRGRGGHGSSPHLTLDPVPVAAQVILAIQAYVARKMNAFDPVVVSVTQLGTGGNAVNVIPDNVTLGATIRTLTDQSLAQIREGLAEVVKSTAEAYGCNYDYRFLELYPPTNNDDDTTDLAVEDMRAQFGDSRVQVINQPMMGSEDFAFVADLVPSTFVGLLASPPDMDAKKAEFNHSPRVVFDDDVLADEAAALASMAYGRLLRAQADSI